MLGLALVMKAPVWFIIARVDFIGGHGWDRAALIDAAVRHFSDWWLLGTKSNASWGADTWDACNEFVYEATSGGLATFILFVAMLSRAFGMIGKARKRVEGSRQQEWFFWCVGAALYAHVMGFWGIDYFDVIRTWWYIFLAMIPAATLAARISAAKEPKPILVGETSYAGALMRILRFGRPAAAGRSPRSRGDFSTEITRYHMKLSIVIICWNDWKVIENCLRSIFESTHKIQYEVIVSDNGSTDGSVEKIRAQFPAVRVVENRANLGFAKGNNAGIREAGGEYVLILNPDTIIHDGSLDRWIEFADRHPEAGAFGCRVHNPDGTYQRSARPFPTISRYLVSAFGLRFLGHLNHPVLSDEYEGWKGDTEREVDWQSGCCVMLRGDLLKKLGGFDEQFFYQFEEVDLCRRVWGAGYRIRFTPEVSITHLGGQSVGRFPVRFAIEVCRNGYRYFYKHYGARGARQYRRMMLTKLRIRQVGYGFANLVRPNDMEEAGSRCIAPPCVGTSKLDPVQFVEHGIEQPVEQVPVQTTS